MPLLFSYGTLQQEDVQLATFGRRLAGSRDALAGFEPARVTIEDAATVRAIGRTFHANVRPAADRDSRVPGTVFEISDAELARADEFEAAFSYRRIAAPLASGVSAWVYVYEPHGGR
jgi:gamma-glutamylcyclotransferase (GGCT)/AIG2-like uncharacterized protein YtfP